jgi:hypothetical protein
MRTANIIQLNHIHSGLLCEQCCRALVVPRQKWLEELQEHLHILGEIMLIMGKGFAAALLLAQFIVEAVFPHLNRNKHPDELEFERAQKEWQAKRDTDARKALEDRVTNDANEEAAYLNSLRLSFAHRKESCDDAFLVEERNNLVDQMEAESRDPEKDRILLRKYAVEIEQLRLHEMLRNQRRRDLQKETDYHVSEMRHWVERANDAPDSEEKARCMRESEIHGNKAQHANNAFENA